MFLTDSGQIIILSTKPSCINKFNDQFEKGNGWIEKISSVGQFYTKGLSWGCMRDLGASVQVGILKRLAGL